MEPGLTEETEQSAPPTETVVAPLVSQNPLPVTTMVCPPWTDPVSGVTEEMAMLLVRLPRELTALPWPSTLTITS
jgi:hypothetical protein